MDKLALWVVIRAKAGKEKEVAEFLQSAVPLVNAEPQKRSWFALRLGPSSFGIFDTFETESGREAHLSGKVAAMLMQKAPELLAEPPKIEQIDVLASKAAK